MYRRSSGLAGSRSQFTTSSRCQESLEAEKSSKEVLVREASEMKVLLGENLALLEAEKKKADDEGEARRRLESMLLAEKKKEEEMVGSGMTEHAVTPICASSLVSLPRSDQKQGGIVVFEI